MRGGVVVRVENALFFVAADIARKVVPLPELARVPGAPPELRGVALVDGTMIPVIDLSREPRIALTTPSRPMLVCSLLGESFGLMGMDIVASGRFESATEGVRFEESVARDLDVAAAIARVREGVWAV
jgi:hypothetical protein